LDKLRGYWDLPDGTASDITGQLAARRERMRQRLRSVRHVLAVMSGKGGVGKSLISANLAAALASDGRAVGVLDADLNGPSMARLLGAAEASLRFGADSVEPAVGVLGVKVMSMDLVLAGDETPLRWVGPERERFLWQSNLAANVIREFLADTNWGRLDYLILDLPPGTDSITTIRDLLPGLGGMLAVTLPSRLSHFVVRKSLVLAAELGIPVIGYVENMAGYACPTCGGVGPLFESEAAEFPDVTRLTSLPFDPEFGRDSELGRLETVLAADSEAGRAVRVLATRVEEFFEG
jgi:ATP-binding protein involved in chromosome partitioning